jgi:hypothetical protein
MDMMKGKINIICYLNSDRQAAKTHKCFNHYANILVFVLFSHSSKQLVQSQATSNDRCDKPEPIPARPLLRNSLGFLQL